MTLEKPTYMRDNRTGQYSSETSLLTNVDQKNSSSVKGMPTNRFLKHPPLKYGKKMYLGEFLMERLVQLIAFASIAAILAIFYYVFQEATWAFRGDNRKTETVVPEQLAPSVYGEKNNLKPASYSAEDELEPTSYGVPDEKLTLESNGGASETITTTSLERGMETSRNIESSGNNSAVSVHQLVLPNDTIGGKAHYIWQPVSQVPKYSFIPLFVGALKVTLIAILLSAPLAILAAMFTVSFSPRWLREILKPAIEILAGFPSVVIGFFCLITIATVTQEMTGSVYRLNALVGGVGMALAVIPIIYTVTEDALSAVPKFMKEASLALGASRWQTALRVILPAATPGVFAALILGFGRAFGETMIALMATGNAALVSSDIFDSVRTMAATIGAEMAEVEFHSVHYGVLFLIGAVLFVVTFTLNAVAEFYVRKRLIKKFQGM